MINKMKELDPEATKETVKNKINSLRSGYRKELKKVNASIRSGAGTEDIYEPSLWYFHQLDFVRDHENPRQSMSNFDDIPSQDESSMLSSPYPRPHSQESTHSDNSFDPPFSYGTVPPTSPNPDIRSLPPRRLKKRTIDNDNNINEAINNVGSCITKLSQQQSQPQDRHDSFGQNVAHKLRNMSNEQRIYTEKLINEAIFEGELGNLNRHCSIFIPSNNINIPLDVSGINNNTPQTRNIGGFQNEAQMFNSVPDTESLQPTVGTARNFVLSYVP